ncbi:MAG: hypothetical protein ACI87A_003807 [Planctomycetota bacterium]|jgi:hypothetical protein
MSTRQRVPIMRSPSLIILALFAGLALAQEPLVIADEPVIDESKLGHHELLVVLMSRIDQTMVTTSEELQDAATGWAGAKTLASELSKSLEHSRSIVRDIDTVLSLVCDCPSNCASS